MKKLILISIFAVVVVSLSAQTILPAEKADVLRVNNRPALENRLFSSEAVEAKIREVVGLLTNKRLAWMFVNCFPNTLDTTVHFDEKDTDGLPDTFVYSCHVATRFRRTGISLRETRQK